MLSIDIIIYNRSNSIYELRKLSLYPSVNIFTNLKFETIIHFNTKHNDDIFVLLPKMLNTNCSLVQHFVAATSSRK